MVDNYDNSGGGSDPGTTADVSQDPMASAPQDNYDASSYQYQQYGVDSQQYEMDSRQYDYSQQQYDAQMQWEIDQQQLQDDPNQQQQQPQQQQAPAGPAPSHRQPAYQPAGPPPPRPYQQPNPGGYYNPGPQGPPPPAFNAYQQQQQPPNPQYQQQQYPPQHYGQQQPPRAYNSANVPLRQPPGFRPGYAAPSGPGGAPVAGYPAGPAGGAQPPPFNPGARPIPAFGMGMAGVLRPELGPPVPWTTDIFGFLQDCHGCPLVVLAPCIAFGQIAEITDTGYNSCITASVIYGLACMLGFPCLYSYTYRTKMRHGFNLRADPMDDFCVHLWCELCALSQEYRELSYRGIDPTLGYAMQATTVNQAMKAPIAPRMMK